MNISTLKTKIALVRATEGQFYFNTYTGALLYIENIKMNDSTAYINAIISEDDCSNIDIIPHKVTLTVDCSIISEVNTFLYALKPITKVEYNKEIDDRINNIPESTLIKIKNHILNGNL